MCTKGAWEARDIRDFSGMAWASYIEEVEEVAESLERLDTIGVQAPASDEKEVIPPFCTWDEAQTIKPVNSTRNGCCAWEMRCPVGMTASLTFTNVHTQSCSGKPKWDTEIVEADCKANGFVWSSETSDGKYDGKCLLQPRDCGRVIVYDDADEIASLSGLDLIAESTINSGSATMLVAFPSDGPSAKENHFAARFSCQCPTDYCKGHGSCQAGSCKCDSGWQGQDCSAKIPPIPPERNDNGVVAGIMCSLAILVLGGYFYIAVFSKVHQKAGITN